MSNSKKTTTNQETQSTPTKTKGKFDGVNNFVYIGPSLPGGRLKSLTSLNGTYEQITEYYKEAIELYPNTAKLIVPVTSLAHCRRKSQESGNVMYKYYHGLVNDIKNASGKGDEQ